MPSSDFRPTLTYFNLTMSAKTLFPHTITFTGTRGEDLNVSFWRTQVPTTGDAFLKVGWLSAQPGLLNPQPKLLESGHALTVPLQGNEVKDLGEGGACCLTGQSPRAAGRGGGLEAWGLVSVCTFRLLAVGPWTSYCLPQCLHFLICPSSAAQSSV